MNDIHSVTPPLMPERNVFDAEVVVRDIDDSKQITRAILLTCYPGVSEVRTDGGGAWILRFSDKKNALKLVADKVTLANTFGTAAAAELVSK